MAHVATALLACTCWLVMVLVPVGDATVSTTGDVANTGMMCLGCSAMNMAEIMNSQTSLLCNSPGGCCDPLLETNDVTFINQK